MAAQCARLRVALTATMVVMVGSLEEASEVCSEFISERRLISEAWEGGAITDRVGRAVGRVSYNGRVWPPSQRWETADMTPLYSPF